MKLLVKRVLKIRVKIGQAALLCALRLLFARHRTLKDLEILALKVKLAYLGFEVLSAFAKAQAVIDDYEQRERNGNDEHSEHDRNRTERFRHFSPYLLTSTTCTSS